MDVVYVVIKSTHLINEDTSISKVQGERKRVLHSKEF